MNPQYRRLRDNCETKKISTLTRESNEATVPALPPFVTLKTVFFFYPGFYNILITLQYLIKL